MENKIFFGMWGITSGWGINKLKSNEEDIKKTIKLAYNNGINKFDTASVYGGGLGETIFHDLDFLDELVISTKVPAINKPELNKEYNLEEIKFFYNYEYIEKSVIQSINRIGKNKIDILYLHNWNKSWEKYFTYFIDIFKKLKKRGYVSNVGISLPDDYEGNLNIKNGLDIIDYIQLPHNLFNEKILDNIYDNCKKNNIKIVIRSIFCQGIIFYMKDIKKIDKNDIRLKKYANRLEIMNKILNNFIEKNSILSSDELLKNLIEKYISDTRIDNILLGIPNDINKFKKILKIVLGK